MFYKMRPGNDNPLTMLIAEYLAGKRNFIGIEIGSYAGESAELFVASGAFSTLYCIDPWEMGYDPNDTTAGDGLPIAESEFDKRFRNNPVVVKVKRYSSDAAQMFADGAIDFIYIDGDHRYEHVKEDLELYVPKIKPGGIIAGHDYGGPSTPGVKQAVDEYFGEKPVSLYTDRSWVHLQP